MIDNLSIEVTPDLPAVRRYLRAVEREVIEDAEVDTYNRTMAKARTLASRIIRSRLKIPARLVNARAKLNKATRRFPTARYALGTLYHLPARYLKPTQFKPGVKFRRPSGERRTRPGSFIVSGRSLTNIGPAGRAAERSFVFERTGKDRLPIRQIGVRIERLVLLAFVRAARQVIPGAEHEFVKRFEFRAQRAADKYLRRRRR